MANRMAGNSMGIENSAGFERIRGSTTIRELMERFPDGRAVSLMSALGWPCAHCTARETEPLSLAAKRHGNPVLPAIECFRALEGSGPSSDQIDAARIRPRRSADPLQAWKRSTRRSDAASKAASRRHTTQN